MNAADLLRSVDIVLKVSVLLGGAALATRALSRGSAAARHQIWAVAIAASLAMPLLAVVAPQWTVAVLPVRSTIEDAAPAPPAARQAGVGDAGPVFEPIPTLAPSSGAHTAPAATGANPLSTTVTLWIAGVLVVLARLGFGTARVWWIARRARPAGAWAPLGEHLVQSLGLDRRVTFLSGDPDAMPMAWGLVHARVLLPADADDWCATRQRVVLLHELAHVKRRDCVTQLLAQLACAVYWFNPLVWLAAQRLRAERERACDDLVLASGTRGSDYADHLLDIARSLRAGAWPTWSAVTMAHRSQLEGRLMAILDPALPRRSPTRRSVAVFAALAVLCIVSLAGVRPVARAAEASEPVDESPVVAPSTALEEAAQGRPAAPAQPTPTPIPTPTPTPPAPTPAPLPEFAAGPLPVVEIDPVVIGGAVDIGVRLALGQGGRTDDTRSRSSADPRVVAALTGALKDENKDVREQALHALLQMRAPIAVDVYIGLLKDTEADVRQQAVLALGQLRDPKHVDVIVPVLKDQNADVRQHAAVALGQLRDPRAVDPLIAVLKDASADVRQQAATALGQIRDRRAIDALIAVLKDSNPDVRQQAAFALGQIR